jgi:hypothetical protein
MNERGFVGVLVDSKYGNSCGGWCSNEFLGSMGWG